MLYEPHACIDHKQSSPRFLQYSRLHYSRCMLCFNGPLPRAAAAARLVGSRSQTDLVLSFPTLCQSPCMRVIDSWCNWVYDDTQVFLHTLGRLKTSPGLGYLPFPGSSCQLTSAYHGSPHPRLGYFWE